MSFGKANQRTLVPEYEEYKIALAQYKLKKKNYALFLKLYRQLEYSENPLERLQFFEEKKTHSNMCKYYYYARAKYEDAAARAGCKERGIDLTALEVAKIAQIPIPVSYTDVLKDTRAQEFEEELEANPALSAVAEAAKAHMNEIHTERERKKRTRKTESNTHSAPREMRNEDDPTFEDFSPL